jgi:hypothetical protein
VIRPYVLFCGDMDELGFEKVDDSGPTVHRHVQWRVWVQDVQSSCSAASACVPHPTYWASVPTKV